MSSSKEDCFSCNLANVCIAGKLSQEELNQLNSNKQSKEVQKGDVLYQEDFSSGDIMIIKSGIIKLVKRKKYLNDAIVGLKKTGDIIGLKGLISNRHQVMASCITEANLCLIPKSFINKLISNNNKLCHYLFSIILEYLDNSYNHSAELISNSIESRIAQTLYHIGEDSSAFLDIKRQDIASYVGTSRETVTRFLSELKRKNIIEVSSKGIRIKSKAKLFQIL